MLDTAKLTSLLSSLTSVERRKAVEGLALLAGAALSDARHRIISRR